MTREERMKLYEFRHNKSNIDIKVALNESLFESYFEDIVPNAKEDVSEEEAVIIVDPVEQPSYNDNAEVPSETITPEENGVQNMLQFLVKDEWDAIEGYNNTIQTLLSLEGYEDMCAVLQDIADEELIHVGQLQKLMELVNPSTENISKGEVEADEQLNGNVAPEEEK